MARGVYDRTPRLYSPTTHRREFQPTPLNDYTTALYDLCAEQGGCDYSGPSVRRYDVDLPSCIRCRVPQIPSWFEAFQRQSRKGAA